MRVRLPFRDRDEAGGALGEELAQRGVGENAIVLGLARGGVIVAAAVAKRLQAKLDVLVIRKLGVPEKPELAMGAIAHGTQVLDRQIVDDFGVSREQIEREIANETRELQRRELAYRGGKGEPELQGRLVILVDDGMATGASMLVAVRHVRSCQAQQIIAAVPVASHEAVRTVSNAADECISLAIPNAFYAVGQWYEDFGQVEDEEVCEMLRMNQSGLTRRT